AQRSVFTWRAALFLHDRRASVRRERNNARHAAAVVARSVSAEQIAGRLSALAAGSGFAMPRDRTGLALSDCFTTGLRSRPPRPGQIDGARRTARARSAAYGWAPL